MGCVCPALRQSSYSTTHPSFPFDCQQLSSGMGSWDIESDMTERQTQERRTLQILVEWIPMQDYGVIMRMCVLSHFSHVRLFMTLWTIARQAPLSMGFFQASILEWVAISCSGGSSRPRNRTHVSCLLHRQAGSLPPAPSYLESIHELVTYFQFKSKQLSDSINWAS